MLTIASVMRNEADRFLPKTLEIWRQFTDRIVVLDDGSTDDTAAICRDAGAEVHTEAFGLFGNESPARRKLWDLAVADADGWVLWYDADQIPASDPRPHLTICEHHVCGFYVYDMWGPDVYREDVYWRGHMKPWWRGVFAPAFKTLHPEWSGRGMHAGHLPRNLPAETRVMPRECAVLHYAYSTPELRAEKHEQYMAQAAHLQPKELAHAKTITLPRPNVKPLPFEPTWGLLG